MAVVRNREVCYWEKPSCRWEHCAEVTWVHVSKKNEESERIIREKKCGSFAGERFLMNFAQRLEPADTESLPSFILAFCGKGSDALNAIFGIKNETAP